MTSVQYAQMSKRRSMREEHQKSLGFQDHILFLRHGERLDHVNRTWRATTTNSTTKTTMTTTATGFVTPLLSLLPESDPPLSPAGRRQALETGFMFLQQRRHKKLGQRAIGMLSFLLVSPFHRCIETAMIVNIVGFDGKLAMFVDPLLSEWHSPKLFSRSPRLGGDYVCTAGIFAFQPQWDVLHASLVSFFRSAVADPRYSVDDAVAERWLAVLNAKWDQRSSFLVWTSASMQESLRRSVCRKSDMVQRVFNKRDCGGRNSGSISGISYPENAGGLLRRVGEAINVHFNADSEVAQSSLPPCIREAVREEAMHLPRVIQERRRKKMLTTPAPVAAEEAAESKTAATMMPQRNGDSLLPPTRTMLVTHADVVSMALKHCCSSHHDVDKGFSVPYCSLTSLSRSNDFYSVANDGPSVHAARGQQEKEGRSWYVEKVGWTSHLQTEIFLHYC